MKRLIRLAAIAFAGAFLCSPPSASASAESYSDGIADWEYGWNDDSTGAVLTKYTCTNSPGVVTVPAKLVLTKTEERWNEETGEYEEYEWTGEVPVTELGNDLFMGCAWMTEVVLPDTIREISIGVFAGCENLEKINVPADLVKCGEDAFEGTAWQNAQTNDFLVFGPVILEYRGEGQDVEIPEGVAVIPGYMFLDNEDIVSVSIPDSVREIGDYAFADCEKLRYVDGAKGVEKCGASVFEGTAFLEEVASNAVIRVGSAVIGYNGTLPETLEIEEGVACIADEAFEGCPDFTTVTFPASLRRIGKRSFADCFVWAKMPGGEDDAVSTATAGYADDGIDSAGDSAGDSSVDDDSSATSSSATSSDDDEDDEEEWIGSGLTRVVIPATLESIGEDAFAGCLFLTDVTIEGGEAFEGVCLDDVFSGDCPIANLTINRSRVGEDCWFDTLETLTLGDAVRTIDEEAFYGSPLLTNVTFGAGLESIGAGAFYGCQELTSLAIPASVAEIGDSAFAECLSLSSVTFGEGLEYIGEGAFYGCPELTSVTIPASVKEIADDAFAGCDALEEVVFEGGMDEIDMDLFAAFDGTPWLTAEYPSPENDDVADAEELTGESGSVEGTLLYATVEAGDCILDFADAAATVWYKWEAPFTGTVVFTADAADEEDSWLFRLIAARGRVARPYYGGDDFPPIGSADDSSWDDYYGDSGSDSSSDSGYGYGDDSSSYDSASDSDFDGESWYDDANWVLFDVVEGETYYVSVAAIDDAEADGFATDFTLSWERVYRPANDNFADAIELDGEEGTTSGTSILATAEEDDPLVDAFYSEGTVWWKWTAATDGQITFDTDGSEFDTVMGVYTGESLDTLEEVATNDDEEGSTTSLVTFDATAGTTYYIAVGGYGDEAGVITLSWYRYKLDVDEDGVLLGYRGTLPEELEIPEEVTAIDEYALAGSANLRSVRLSSSVRSIGDGAFAGCEALESIVIPAAVKEIGYGAFEDCASLADVEFEGERDEIDMNPMDAFAGTPWKQDTYLAEFETPGNDNFADAFELTGVSGSVLGTNILATAEAGDPLADAYGSETTVWWKWTAETNDWVTFDAIDSNFDTVIGVYTGESLDALEEVAWGGIDEEGETISATVEAVAGTTYYIAVGGQGDAAGKIALEWYRYKLDVEDGVLLGYRGTLPETLDIPEGVTRIEERVFHRYRYGDEEATIQTVNLPESLESIGECAFANQIALETVNGLGESVDVGLAAFTGTPFRRTTPFRLLINKDNVLTGFLGECPETLEIPDGVVEIGECAFDADFYEYRATDGAEDDDEQVSEEDEWCSTVDGLSAVAIPASVQKIGGEAFCGCENLETVSIANPDVVFSGENPFWGCFALSSIEMEKEGYAQDAWLLTFDTDSVYAWSDGEDNEDEEDDEDEDGSVYYWQLPYKAGDTLTFPADDLTCLMYSIEVTDSEGNVGWLEPWVEVYDEETGDYIIREAYHITAHWVPNAYTLTFDTVGGSEVAPVTQEYGTELVAPEVPVREGYAFVRWEPEFPATMPATNLTFTAVWEAVNTVPEIFVEEPTDAFAGNAQYTGWLRDADGNLVGTILVKAAKANKKGESKLTATVVRLDTGKKLTFKGTVKTGGLASATLSGKGGTLSLSFTDDGMSGSLGAYTVEAAKNVFVSKATDDKASAKLVGKKTWTVTLASAKGFTPFTLAVAAKGKTKVTGVLPDGTKVSASAQAVVGDGGRWAVPVMYAKKYRFGFVAWFEKGADGATSLTGVSDLTALRGPKNSVLDWEPVSEACGPAGSLSAGAYAFAVAAEDVAALVPGVNAALLPAGETVTVVKGKWTAAKAAKVAYKGGWTVTSASKGGAVQNPAALKLTFTAKTGTFKGSFTAYSVKGGKLAKTKFTVNGAVVNGVAYGTAFNKKTGSVPVAIE